MALLPPMLSNSFQVSFLDKTGMKLSFSDNLRGQVKAVSLIIQKPEDFAEPSTFFIAFEEDASGLVSSALQDLFEIDDFTVLIQVMDSSGKTIKNISVDEAWADHIIHGELANDLAGIPVISILGIGHCTDLVKIS
jgi:hypothetical protein